MVWDSILIFKCFKDIRSEVGIISVLQHIGLLPQVLTIFSANLIVFQLHDFTARFDYPGFTAEQFEALIQPMLKVQPSSAKDYFPKL